LCDAYFRDDLVSLAVGGFLSVDIEGSQSVLLQMFGPLSVFVVTDVSLSAKVDRELSRERLMEVLNLG